MKNQRDAAREVEGTEREESPFPPLPHPTFERKKHPVTAPKREALARCHRLTAQTSCDILPWYLFVG